MLDRKRSTHTASLTAYVLNGRYIIGDNVLRDIDPQSIRKVVIHKSGDAPAKWRSLASYGILEIFLRTKVHPESRSLPQIQRWLKLTGPVRFQVDGQFLKDTSLRVVTAAIASLEVRRPVAAGGETIVNYSPCAAAPPPVPPGQIRIRGLVQR
ncbi:hypothetical protein [Hymenobacter sp. CRA2]|uniref:hypothetical protein n=1 Tax=Hymenobacter sp. CRA2 TaxID=1955620 RepID=UPI00098F0DA6|nr:hypothetical protein [Hymenobacter sp. CRA2]OON66920.1 hypothetical protein B0919_20245 [Hymenobacter sp. CRA2]